VPALLAGAPALRTQFLSRLPASPTLADLAPAILSGLKTASDTGL